jgi:predicted RNA-binding protein (virulence factor B family)
MDFIVGDEVSLFIVKKTDIGFNVIINNDKQGLLFENEIFQPIETEMKVKGYIKNIREDGKIDVSLRAQGFLNTINNDCEKILQKLKINKILHLSDKSSSDSIVSQLHMSKKSFKKAIGVLYKRKKIILKPTYIKLIKN